MKDAIIWRVAANTNFVTFAEENTTDASAKVLSTKLKNQGWDNWDQYPQ